MSPKLSQDMRHSSISSSKSYHTETSSTVYTNEIDRSPVHGQGITSYDDPKLQEMLETDDPELLESFLEGCYIGALNSLRKSPYAPCINLDILLQCSYHTLTSVRVAAGSCLAKLNENLQFRDRIAEDAVRAMCVLDDAINSKAARSQSGLRDWLGGSPCCPPVHFMEIVKDGLDEERKNIAWDRLKDLCLLKSTILDECRNVAKFRLDTGQCPGCNDPFDGVVPLFSGTSVIRHLTMDEDGHEIEEKSDRPILWEHIPKSLANSISIKYRKFINNYDDQKSETGSGHSTEKDSVLLLDNNIQTKNGDEDVTELVPNIKIVHMPCSSNLLCNDELKNANIYKKDYFQDKIKQLRENKKPLAQLTQQYAGKDPENPNQVPVQEKSSNVPSSPQDERDGLLQDLAAPPTPEVGPTDSKKDPDFVKQEIDRRSVYPRNQDEKRRATEPGYGSGPPDPETKQGRSLTVPKENSRKGSEQSGLSSIDESESRKEEGHSPKNGETNTTISKIKKIFRKFTYWKKTRVGIEERAK